MIQQAAKPGLQGIRSFGRGKSEPKSRLHHEEWRYDCDDAEDDCGHQHWTLKPASTYDCDKRDGECDANAIVGDPPYYAFCAPLGSRTDVCVPKRAFRHG